MKKTESGFSGKRAEFVSFHTLGRNSPTSVPTKNLLAFCALIKAEGTITNYKMRLEKEGTTVVLLKWGLVIGQMRCKCSTLTSLASYHDQSSALASTTMEADETFHNNNKNNVSLA